METVGDVMSQNLLTVDTDDESPRGA